LNFSSKDQLTQLAISKGMIDWNTLLQGVQNIPFGRNRSRADFSLVLKENRGTCSTKHALIKEIADLNKIEHVELMLAIYKMNDQNTPGIKLKNITSAVDYIPEAHCYLRVRNDRLDITTSTASFDRIASCIILESVITPKQVGQYKIDFHKQFIQDWIIQKKITLSFNQVWQFREQCIQNISKHRNA